jgi:hypothetical protein
MKVITVKQLLLRKFKTIDGLSDVWKNSVGLLQDPFVMIVWGQSAQGKSNFINAFLGELAKFFTILYVALEESHSLSSQNLAKRHELAQLGIKYANHETSYDELVAYLSKRQRAKVIVIDSIQYLHIDYNEYKRLKTLFPKKIFIFISHAKGKTPDGKTADKIRYDAGVKIRIEGFIAFIGSRYGGNKNYVIWEEGAKKYWGTKAFKKHLNR